MTLSEFCEKYALRIVVIYDPSAPKPWMRYEVFLIPKENREPLTLAKGEISSHTDSSVSGYGNTETAAREDFMRKLSGERLSISATDRVMVPNLTSGK
jgi:hypothetical protein